MNVPAASISRPAAGPSVLPDLSPPCRRTPAAIGLGTVLGAVGIGLVAAAAVGSASRRRGAREGADGHAPSRAVRRVGQGAAILGASVLADSAVEHFHGGYHNPAMFAAPSIAAATVAASLALPYPAGKKAAHAARTLTGGTHLLAAAVGCTGLAFHSYNVLARPGGLSWNNLFYAAPIAAPAALVVAGLLGLGAAELQRPAASPTAQRRRGRLLAGFTGACLTATSGEVALLHFRGAFHNPAMFLPVTIPPATGMALLVEAVWPRSGVGPLARRLLQATAALGVIGTGFHAYGIARDMGGWRNWRQNLLAGPPMPAPISFSGMALAGLASLEVIRQGEGR